MSRQFYDASSQFTVWTKTEDTMLKKLILDGRNSAQIAETLGRTRASIFARKSKLGIKAKMTPARGSNMPYVGFGKKPRGYSEPAKPVVEEQVIETVLTEVETYVKPVSIGSQIDSLISSVKELGLNLKIEISTDDGRTTMG